jgi:alpha-L-fucosidase
MIIKQYIKDFEALGMGTFVHFGLYSMLGEGEWAYRYLNESERAEYGRLKDSFNPHPNWADDLARTAKAAGSKYITLTTRHHDGFSLYDTSGLSDFDAPHGAAGRDLVGEFVDACRKNGLVPFFYHTLLDWHKPEYYTDFPRYLQYLRDSVKLLCTRYGKIGGIWFDGMWDRKDADWQEDELYGMIRKYQPEAMIINNTGLCARGALGHIELDSVTFERGNPGVINCEGAPKYVASEMCQIFATHWGYAKGDFNYKSLKTIIEDLCSCRRYGANFLLNVGPMGDGLLRGLDKEMLLELGRWTEPVSEALYSTRPADICHIGYEKNFVLRGCGCYYLFCHDLPTSGSGDLIKNDNGSDTRFSARLGIKEKIKSIRWLDGYDLPTYQVTEDGINITIPPYHYGYNEVVRILKIETEK